MYDSEERINYDSENERPSKIRLRKRVVFKLEDIVLPQMDLPDPCPIRIEITDDSVLLFIGRRDFQWDKETQEWLASGMDLS